VFVIGFIFWAVLGHNVPPPNNMITTIQPLALGADIVLNKKQATFPAWTGWCAIAIGITFVPLVLMPFVTEGPFHHMVVCVPNSHRLLHAQRSDGAQTTIPTSAVPRELIWPAI